MICWRLSVGIGAGVARRRSESRRRVERGRRVVVVAVMMFPFVVSFIAQGELTAWSTGCQAQSTREDSSQCQPAG